MLRISVQARSSTPRASLSVTLTLSHIQVWPSLMFDCCTCTVGYVHDIPYNKSPRQAQPTYPQVNSGSVPGACLFPRFPSVLLHQVEPWASSSPSISDPWPDHITLTFGIFKMNVCLQLPSSWATSNSPIIQRGFPSALPTETLLCSWCCGQSSLSKCKASHVTACLET